MMTDPTGEQHEPSAAAAGDKTEPSPPADPATSGDHVAPPPADATANYICPECSQPLAPVEGVAALLRCPACGREFFMPAADEPPPEAEPDVPPPPDEELSALRIRNLAAARRATYRARSYCLIAAAACLVCVVQLIWMIARQTHERGWGLQCTGYALFAALGLYGLLYFVTRARQLHREAKRSALSEPTTPPDFSTLDDGSKQWKNLEEVR
jgi:hypothetical protein